MQYKNLVTHGKNKSKLSSGFTIVELLVVIVVIGILAAITIVSYTGISQKATAAALKSDLKNASTQLEMDKVTNGTYPATKEAANNGRGLQTSPGTILDYVYVGGSDSYSLAATKSSTSYFITSTDKTPTIGSIVAAIGWEQITSGGSHTCAVTNNKIYCWGSNEYGQLGNNSVTNSRIPVSVDMTGVLNGKTVTAISAGTNNTCAIANNLAYCWGYNGIVQPVINTTAFNVVPTAIDTSGVLNGKTVTAISAGDYATCAIANGQAYCWGFNADGELGNNTTTGSAVPVAVNIAGVLSGKTVTAISAGDYHTCAIANGQAYCWGYNGDGEFGNTNYTDSLVPVAVNIAGVLSGKTVTAISAGNSHTCAIANNQAYCWGANWDGQLGNNSAIDDSPTPVAVDITGVLSGKTITVISTGNSNTCAIANSQAYCWGSSWDGQLGNNNATGSSSIPITVNTAGVLSGKTITVISTGEAHVCVLANAQANCWGHNWEAQLGNNAITSSGIPVSVDINSL